MNVCKLDLISKIIYKVSRNKDKCKEFVRKMLDSLTNFLSAIDYIIIEYLDIFDLGQLNPRLHKDLQVADEVNILCMEDSSYTGDIYHIDV